MRHETKRNAFLRNGVEKEVSDGRNNELSRESGLSAAACARRRRIPDGSNLCRAFDAKTRAGARTCGRTSCIVRKKLGGISHGNEEVVVGSSYGSNSIR